MFSDGKEEQAIAEVSCGWAKLPVWRNIVTNPQTMNDRKLPDLRQHQLKLMSGSPFDRDVRPMIDPTQKSKHVLKCIA